MKIMWWQKKKNLAERKNCLNSRFIISVSLFTVLAIIIALVDNHVALADADSDLRNEVYNYKTAQKVKACRKTFNFSSEVKLSESNLNNYGDKPYDEGVLVRRERVNCDILYLANQNGHGDYFAKYFKEHAKLDDVPFRGDIWMTDSRNHTAKRTSDMLDRNDLRTLTVKESLLTQAIDSYPVPNISDAAWAQMYWEAIVNYCAKDKSNPFTEASDGEYSYKAQDENGKYVVKRGYINYATSGDLLISVWPGHHGNTGKPDMDCKEAVKKYSELANAHVEALNKHVDDNPNDNNNSDADSGEGSEGEEEKDKCNAGLFGFGFLLCPGQNLLSVVIGWLYSIIDNILNWQLLNTDSSQIKSYWENFLSIANIILVIAFLVIIYSTATSTGLANYDIKKMLPRIIILAIVINTSFYLCAAIVDLCNITGRGVMALLAGASTGAGDLGLNEKITKVATNVATGVAGGIAGVAAGAILFVSIGAPAALALIVIILALIFRGVALTMMVIISPIAVALYLFPNASMNKWHVKWRDAFIKMLLVYPMFMAVWGGSKLIASATADTQDPITGFITSLMCAIAPAMAIVPLFKMSGDIMGRATAAIAGSKLANSAATGIHGAVSKSRPVRQGSSILPNALQAAQNRFGDTPLVGGVLRSAGVNKAISAADKKYNELDKQAMENANDKISRMNGGQLQEAFLNGTVDGNQIADTHTMRAIIAKQAPNATMEQVQQSMQSINARANWLRENGREREANELRRSYADAMAENGKSGLSAATLNNWADNGWSNDQFNANYTDAIANYASGLSAESQADMSTANLAHIRQTLQNSAANGGNPGTTDAGIHNMADQARIALADPDIAKKMSNASREAMQENSLMRTSSEQRIADSVHLPNIYHNFNSGNMQARNGAVAAATMIVNSTDFNSGYSRADRDRLTNISRAGMNNRGAAPVQVASWDRRA